MFCACVISLCWENTFPVRCLETYRRFMLKEDVVLEVEIKKEKTGFFSFHFFLFS